MTKRIAVLLSGRGSNFEALADSVAAGRIPDAEISIVISNREGAPGIDRAKARNIATKVISSKGLERETFDRQVIEVLKEHHIDLVCLAGYMRLLSPYFVAAFPNRILNIHPSLEIPEFEASVKEVMTTLKPVDKVLTDRDNNRYVMRILPCRTLESTIDGAVITIIPITPITVRSAAEAR